MITAKAPQKVLLNGCFDGLHEGHKYVLRSAAGFGSLLVIGLNSDASVKAAKGEGRPVHNFEERANAIAQFLGTLDPFTPYQIVEFNGDALKFALKESPDVIIRGWDQASERGLPCGLVRLSKYGDYSTTAEIAKNAAEVAKSE